LTPLVKEITFLADVRKGMW